MVTQGRLPVAPSWAADGTGRTNGAFAVEPVSRRGQIVSALREAIVTSKIPIGTQLKQDEIGALFGASPGPAREALRQLVSEGLVEHHPNRGAFVTDIPTDELLEVVLPVRLVAESYAMKRLARNLQPDLVQRLRDQITAMDRGAEREDLAEVIEADVEFHRITMVASGAYHVIQLWNSVLPRIRAQLYRLGPRHRSLAEVPEEHRQLLAALQTGDPQVIDTVLKEHIIDASSMLLASGAPTSGSVRANRLRRGGTIHGQP